MLQKQVEGVAVVMVSQMTEFVKQYIVLKYFREADDIEIEVYIVSD